MTSLIGVDTTRVGVSGLSDDKGIHFGSSDDVHDKVGVLRVRYEDLRRRLISGPVVTGVTHDANDLIGIDAPLIVEDEVTSNWVLSPPRISRETLVDDHHAWCGGGISIRELASGNHRKGPASGSIPVSPCECSLPTPACLQDSRPRASTGAGNRHRRCSWEGRYRRHRLNRGHLAKRVEYPAVVIVRLCGGLIPSCVRRDAQDEKIARVEADINTSQLGKCPGQQPSPDEQHHRGCDFGNHKTRAQSTGASENRRSS